METKKYRYGNHFEINANYKTTKINSFVHAYSFKI